MALRQAKIQPTLQEKRYITLQFLEAAFVSGNRVAITPVTSYSLSKLSKETFVYGDKIDTYIIYDERPKVSLLKKFGWYREDEESLPQIAIIPTHLLFKRFAWDTGVVLAVVEQAEPVDGDQWFDIDNSLLYIFSIDSWDAGQTIVTEEPELPTVIGDQWFDTDTNTLYTVIPGPIVNEVLLQGNDMQQLIKFGYSDTYELRPLGIKRGTLVDVFYDFAPEVEEPTPEESDGFFFKMDESTVANRFYVADPKIDTVSINYTCKLMPYKYQGAKEDPAGNNFTKVDLASGGID